MATEEESQFPGLNKRHGFFKAIERNQRDRDVYHHKVEQSKQAKQEQVRKEKKAKQRPPTELYKPPGSRPQPEALYCLEIEVGPNEWHKQTIDKTGQADRISKTICRQYRLDNHQQKAITELIDEFETKLKV